jgi:hypothetical protein
MLRWFPAWVSPFAQTSLFAGLLYAATLIQGL